MLFGVLDLVFGLDRSYEEQKMKNILLIISLFILASALPDASFCQVVQYPVTSVSCAPVTIATTPTAVVVSTGSQVSINAILAIQNQGSNPIFCSQSSSVSTSGSNLGFEVPASNADIVYFTLPNSLQFYCIAETAASQAVVCKTQ